MASCTYKKDGCPWEGLKTKLEEHINLENLTPQSWLDGCDYPKVTCLFCNDEELTRREYKERLIGSTNNMLSIGDIKDILNTSWPARNKWHFIGINLGVSSETLRIIGMEERKTEDCFRRVIEEWLNSGGVKNWAILHDSVNDFKVDYADVAEDILITATCKKGKKFIVEKYMKQAKIKLRQADELRERERKLAKEYEEKWKDVERMVQELTSWQGQLKQHESEYEDLSKKKDVREESASIMDQLKRCQQNIVECKEKIRGLENDIVQGRSKLRDIDTALTQCKTQLQITLNELKHCKEILKRNESSLEEEQKKNIQNKAYRIAERVAIGGVGTYLVGWTVGLLSPLTGPLAPFVAGAAAATALGGWTVAAGAAVYDHFIPAHFNEEQKKVDREYSDVSARCKETIKHVEEVAMEARKRVEELRLITVDYDKALSTI